MEAIARQVLRSIRGSRSQVAFSRRLGYGANVAAQWEAGRRFPVASQMLKACRLNGIDVEGAFRRFTPESASALGTGDDAGIAAYLTTLLGRRPLGALANRIGRSRFQVSRWLKGTARPRVPDFLRLLDGLTDRLSDCIGALVNVEEVPSLVGLHRQREAAKELAYQDPWTELLLMGIESSDYRRLPEHIPGWLTTRLALPPDVEVASLERMEAAGLIARQGARFVPGQQMTVYTRSHPEVMRTLKGHWADVARGRIRRPDDRDLFAYNVFAATPADVRLIRELLEQTFQELRGIVASSPGTEAIGLVNLQLVNW